MDIAYDASDEKILECFAERFAFASRAFGLDWSYLDIESQISWYNLHPTLPAPSAVAVNMVVEATSM